MSNFSFNSLLFLLGPLMTIQAQQIASEIQLSALFDNDVYLDSTTYWTGYYDDRVHCSLALGHHAIDVRGYLYVSNSDESIVLRGIRTDEGYRFAEFYEDDILTANLYFDDKRDTLIGSWVNMDKTTKSPLYFVKSKHRHLDVAKRNIDYRIRVMTNPNKGTCIELHESRKNYYLFLSDVNISYFYHGDYVSNMLTTDLRNDRYEVLTHRIHKNGQSFATTSESHLFNEIKDSLWLEQEQYVDFAQSISVSKPLCAYAEGFNRFINSIVNEWVNQLLKRTYDVELDAENRWQFASDIWFEPYYFAKGIISGALYLKTNSGEVNRVKTFTYNLKKDEQIPVTYWIRDTNKLLSDIGLKESYTMNEQPLSIALCSNGIMLCQPFDIIQGGQHRFISSRDVWEHITFKARLLGLVKKN